MSPLVSIVIPVFNRAAIITEAVEGCLAQTYPHLEIILVDDCSSDDLDGALRPWNDHPKVRLVRHGHNQGVSAARNSGVAAAKGDYVAFLDSDDVWLPAKLERQVDLAAAQEDRRFIIGTLTEVINSPTDTQFRPERRKTKDVPLGDYLFVHKVRQRLPKVSFEGTPFIEGCFAQTSSYFLPRELAQETPFRVGMHQYEDMAFLIDLDDQGVDFLLVEEPLTQQRNDDRPGRLGARDDLVRGHQFLDAIGGSLSPEARLAFEAGYLAHLQWKESRLRALSITLRAFLRGAIPSKTMLGILSRCLLGQESQKALRNTLRSWRNSAGTGQAI